MPAETDLIKLYSQRILALAAETPHLGRLEDAGGSSRRRSPLCGSTVTVDVTMADGRIAGFGQEVKACALGQAAAAVVGANAVGRRRDEIEAARDALRAMLKGGGDTPGPPFDELRVLEPARDYKNRHASIMLSLEATLEAVDEAEGAGGA